MTDGQRWSVEQVAAVAPSGRSVAAAEPLAVDSRWSAAGADERALWGRCVGSGAEPYDTMVDHVEVAWQCSCPSRVLPCKHAVALLLFWARGGLAVGACPARVTAWIERRDQRSGIGDRASTSTGEGGEAGVAGDGARGGVAGLDGGVDDVGDPAPPEPIDRGELDRSRDERVARMLEGLAELDRWLEDRMRTGLSDSALGRYATWDELAARLVDARAGALANRVRRLAGLVGASPDWHADVLAELGMLHLISQAGRRLGELPGPLADAVATASGWQVRRADVLAGVPDTDEWFVAGRSDQREDRIEVRRMWLRGERTRRWAMLLSFAAYQQSLDGTFDVGTVVSADLHRYPGGSLRALPGTRLTDPLPLHIPPATTVAVACDEIGGAVAAEPWIERYPATVLAAPSVADGRWMLGDDTGSLLLLGDTRSLGTLVAASEGRRLVVTVEWTAHGVIPLTVHLPDRVLDIGPRADPTFVDTSAA